MTIKIVCHELIVMSRVASNIQYSQVAGRTPAVASLFSFLRHGPVPRKVVKFNAGLSQILSKIFLSMAVIKSWGPGISPGFLECGPSYFHWKIEEK